VNADDLQRYRADVAAWAEECVQVRSPATGTVGPLRLADHQRVFLRDATRRGPDRCFVHRTCVASWPRREGKSLVVALLLAWRMTCFTGQRLLILANSERQAQSNVFALLTEVLRDSPALQGYVPEDCFLATKLTVPGLDNLCECVPCNWRTVQGRPRTDVLACDELHAAENPKAFEFASNQLEGIDAQCLLSSQAGPPVPTNPVFRLYQARDEAFLFFSYLTEHVLPWAVALAERERKVLLPGEWEYMHRNAWGATGLKLFAAPAVEAAALPYTEPQTREEWEALKQVWGFEEAPCVIGAGLDRAGVSRTGDRTVWGVTARFDVDRDCPLFRVVRCAVLPTGSEAEVLAEDRRTRAVFGSVAAVMVEAYQGADLAGRVNGATLEHPTTQRQQGLFGRLFRLFEEGRIGFPMDAGTDPKTGAPGLLKAELLAFEYDAERAGLTKFGTQAGAHDDTVYSLAWATEAASAARLEWWRDRATTAWVAESVA